MPPFGEAFLLWRLASAEHGALRIIEAINDLATGCATPHSRRKQKMPPRREAFLLWRLGGFDIPTSAGVQSLKTPYYANMLRHLIPYFEAFLLRFGLPLAFYRRRFKQSSGHFVVCLE